jgi:hypothetical protein
MSESTNKAKKKKKQCLFLEKGRNILQAPEKIKSLIEKQKKRIEKYKMQPS